MMKKEGEIVKVDFRIPESDDGRVQARQLLQDDSMAT